MAAVHFSSNKLQMNFSVVMHIFQLFMNFVNKKAFQSKANHLLADRCMGYIENTF